MLTTSGNCTALNKKRGVKGVFGSILDTEGLNSRLFLCALLLPFRFLRHIRNPKRTIRTNLYLKSRMKADFWLARKIISRRHLNGKIDGFSGLIFQLEEERSQPHEFPCFTS